MQYTTNLNIHSQYLSIENKCRTNAPYIGSEVLAEISCTGVEGNRHTADLTEWVQDIADEEADNYGLVFMAKEEGTGETVYGPEIQYSYNEDGSIKMALYMRLDIVYRDKNISDIDLIEYDYETKTEREFNYEYDGTLNNVVENGYILEGIETAERGVQPFTIYPGDTLEEANASIYPYTTIVHMAQEGSDANNFDTYRKYGTGYVIGPNVIATGGHNVVSGTTHTWEEDMVVLTSADNPQGMKRYNVKRIICPNIYYSTRTALYDWAIVIVDVNIGEDTGWMGFGSSYDFSEKNVTVAGYTTVSGTKDLYKKSGTISSVTQNKLFYFISTQGGQSGGPVFDDDNIAWGIHVHGFIEGDTGVANSGIRIDACIYSLLKHYKDISKEEYNYE